MAEGGIKVIATIKRVGQRKVFIGVSFAGKGAADQIIFINILGRDKVDKSIFGLGGITNNFGVVGTFDFVGFRVVIAFTRSQMFEKTENEKENGGRRGLVGGGRINGGVVTEIGAGKGLLGTGINQGYNVRGLI